MFVFDDIIGHEGPLKQKDEHYLGSRFNVMIKWTNGEVTREPLGMIAKDDPLSCALYAEKHNLLNTPSWKRFKRILRRHKKVLKAFKAKKKFKSGPVYLYGVRIPQNASEARRLDKENENRLWVDSEDLKVAQLLEYDTFLDLGIGGKPPPGFKRIPYKVIYTVKHDLRRKTRIVAGGHRTEPCGDEAYSGVISLRCMRFALVYVELNGLKVMVGDVGNAYLESYTKEKVYIIAGPEFGELEGHTLVVQKALYGLRTSGERFHDRMADILREMGFFPC